MLNILSLVIVFDIEILILLYNTNNVKQSNVINLFKLKMIRKYNYCFLFKFFIK